MRTRVCYPDLFYFGQNSYIYIYIYKNGLGNAHPALCTTSWSWTVLLPSDTHRNPITSITAVLLPSVIYLLTLYLRYIYTYFIYTRRTVL
jgi:hypothetical protein